jgi:hypothetical protein
MTERESVGMTERESVGMTERESVGMTERELVCHFDGSRLSFRPKGEISRGIEKVVFRCYSESVIHVSHQAKESTLCLYL